MAKIYKNICELTGNTPLVALDKIKKIEGCFANICAKLERNNPSGSIKDRAALWMIEAAEKAELIADNTTIIEPTSGNTGIGLAAICAAKNYKLVLTMPETMSVERRKILKAYGAEIVLTEGALGIKGAIDKAEELKKAIPDSIILGQFINIANPQAHRMTTGPEIYKDTDGEVDILVCGVGTGGTITGAGAYLKAKKSSIKIIAVEPSTSAVLSGEAKGAHKIQGIGAGFIPKILDTAIIDEVIKVSNEDAYSMANKLAKEEGILAGISSGAALFAATVIAKRAQNKGKTLVVVLPDTGERYLSTDLFD